MNVNLSLPGGFGAALEPLDLPVEGAVAMGDQAPVLYPVAYPQLDPPLPLPALDPPVPLPAPSPPLTTSEPPPEEQAACEPAGDVSQDTGVDPQQWLTLMLSQQDVQVQARDLAATVTQVLPGERSSERLLPRMTAHYTQDPPASRDAVKTAAVSGAAKYGSVQAAEELVMLLERREPTVSRVVMPVAGASERIALATSAMVSTTAVVESLSGTEVSVTPATPVQGSPVSGPVLERALKLDAPQARWGEQMLQALRETVEVQVQQRFQQATIRLDPPELGSMEIFISHESGRLSVHISAVQTDVARLLASTSERLRQELVEQNSLQVQVQVSSDSRGQSSRDQGRAPRPPAIADAVQDAQVCEPGADSSTQRDNGVLVTV